MFEAAFCCWNEATPNKIHANQNTHKTHMTSIEARITALEAEIEQLTSERNRLPPSDETKEDRRGLLAAITAKEVRLHDLERRAQQGKIFCKIPIDGCSFNICCCLSI
jgi:uncharacterized small protein (DUF1192 family)